MIRSRRRLLINTALLGIGLTLLVMLADYFGFLNGLEHAAYDQRAAECQYFTPAPTDKLVHLDIDDRAVEVIGRWPWPRGQMAQMLDEIRLAGPKALAMDIILDRPQEIEHAPRASGAYEAIDHDRLLAASIARLGNAIIPVAMFAEAKPLSRAAGAMFDQLLANLEIDEQSLHQKLLARGFTDAELNESGQGRFFELRRRAMHDRIMQSLEKETCPAEQLMPRLLKTCRDDVAWNSPLTRVFLEQYEKARAELSVRRFSFSRPAGSAPFLESGGIKIAPLAAFSLAAAGSAFVDFRFFPDGTVRSVPLLAENDGRVYPQMGLAMACRMLDVDLKDLRYTADELIIPLAGGKEIRVPVRAEYSSIYGRAVPALIDIPWFGGREWETMYDYPSHKQPKQHLSMNAVWGICATRRRIAANNANVDDAIACVYEYLYQTEKAEAYLAKRPPSEDTETRAQFITHAFIDAQQKWRELSAYKPEDLGPKDAAFVRSIALLKDAAVNNAGLQSQLSQMRGTLAEAIRGRAVLIGYTATGSLADVVPTSLHARCPGVVIHGTIFNAIMTGRVWRRAPAWVTLLLTAAAGLLTALASVKLPPFKALAVSVLLLVSLLALNGVVLMGYACTLVGASSPTVAIFVVWSGCALVRIVVESSERAFLKSRFQTYVDPRLVNYVVEHPERVRLEGEVRVLSVCFTDLVEFTPLSERLGQQSVTLLNAYMQVMVPIIRANRGYVNKFLGDGIMFFYGAPQPSDTHACDAVRTALQMQQALAGFNRQMAERGFPAVAMRVGISTGKMVVGDAGAADASDYTVLGDAVNLGSRLESANKLLGTRILMSQGTRDLAGDEFLIRPVGTFRFVGKHIYIPTYEVIGLSADATDAQRRLVELTSRMVKTFSEASFHACAQCVDDLDREFGVTKLTHLYREQCERYQRESPPTDFAGQIVLTEK